LSDLRTTAQEVPDSTDEVLMERFMAGEVSAFDELFRRYAGKVRQYLRRLTGDDQAAEDVTQSTFISVVNGRGRFRSGSPFRPWLYAIATNAARDWARRRRPESLTPEGELPEGAAVDSPPELDPGLSRQVQSAVAALPESLRTPLVMHRFEELPIKDIAQALGLTQLAVKLRLHRAYERLRGSLAPLRGER
jgi:RNA polymerase sigma-70 factor (ECF subfamily)